MTTRRTLQALGGLLVIYLAVPVLAFADRLLRSHQRGFSTPGLWPAVGVSLEASTISLALMTLFGVPLAYALARNRSRLSTVVGVIVQLPLAIPPIMGGILLVYLIGPYSWLGVHFDRNLTESLTGVVIAQTFVSSGFLVVAARSAFEAVDPTLGDVAAACGHGSLARFWQIDLRGASAGIKAGMVLAWLRAFGEYGAVVIIAYHPFSLPVYTEEQFSASGLPTTQAPTFIGLVVAGVAIYLGRAHWRGRRRPAPATLPAGAPPAGTVAAPVSFDLDTTVGDFRLQLAYRAASHRLAIVGPSGSGKTMTLRSLAGLRLGAGAVRYGSRNVTEVPPEGRRVGYVPQGAGLLPGRRVWQQVNFAVDAVAARASWWLSTLRILELAGRLPDELSGGQAKRVALARALARDPEVVLLDEPFSALDAPVRDELCQEVRRLQHQAGLSTVLVTHDPEEAAMLADEILVISDGRLLQAGPCEEVFRHPASIEIARLLRIDNVRHGVVASGGIVEVHEDGRVPVPIQTTTDYPVGVPVLWSVHPIELALGDDGAYRATLIDATYMGSMSVLTVELESGVELRAWNTRAEHPAIGDPCRLRIDPGSVRVWVPSVEAPASTGPHHRQSFADRTDPGH